MKKTCVLFAIFCYLLLLQSSAQVIPDSLRADWSKAGYEGVIPDASLILNVKDFGAYADGMHDDYNAVINAISSSSLFRVIYFPAGNYLIKSAIKVPANVVLRGEGEISNLRFDLSRHNQSTDCINVSKTQNGVYTNISSGYAKGSFSVTVVNSSAFTINGYAEIKENNGDWDPDKTIADVGQIVKIISKNGNVLNFTPALHIDYTDSLQPRIRPVNLTGNTGLECFKLTRLDTPTIDHSGKNIVFQYANNCWVTGVESEFCQTAHIVLIACAHITLSGCYIHDAFTYNGGGQGYGIFMHGHTSDCKVENSVFERLRHAMILSAGANGNVYAYNYSTDPRSTTEIPPDNIGDLSLHGNYAFSNLFEGNIVQNIIVDDFWGASGPYNTFFRNRAALYGIEIFDQYNYAVKSDRQNLVGNEVTNTDSLKGNYYIQTSDHFEYDNNIRDTIQPAGTNNLTDSSYYLKAKPYFWNVSSPWPSIGGSNVLNSGTNPAKERYLSGGSKIICLKEPSSLLNVTVKADNITCNGGTATVTITAKGGRMPYEGTGVFSKPAGGYVFLIKDAFGYTDSEKINIGQPLPINVSYTATRAGACRDDGSITIKRTGGKPPFKYSIDGNTYVAANLFSNLAAGNYTAWVKDKTGCVDSLKNIMVNRIAPLTAAIKKNNTSCKTAIDGKITVKATGGTKPYLYSLDSINFVSSGTFTNLQAGTYTVWVTDAKACTFLSTVIISKGKANCSSTATSFALATVLPNSSAEKFMPAVRSYNKEKIQFIITGFFGSVIYKANGTTGTSNVFGEKFMPGIYILKPMQDNQFKTYKTIKL